LDVAEIKVGQAPILCGVMTCISISSNEKGGIIGKSLLHYYYVVLTQLLQQEALLRNTQIAALWLCCSHATLTARSPSPQHANGSAQEPIERLAIPVTREG